MIYDLFRLLMAIMLRNNKVNIINENLNSDENRL